MKTNQFTYKKKVPNSSCRSSLDEAIIDSSLNETRGLKLCWIDLKSMNLKLDKKIRRVNERNVVNLVPNLDYDVPRL